MTCNEYRTLSSRDIMPDPCELSARLGYEVTGGEPEVLEALLEIKNASAPRYAFREVEIMRRDGGIDLGFGLIESDGLKKALFGATRAYVIAVTLGVGVDRLIKGAQYTSLSHAFMLDAVASAYCEECFRAALLEITDGATRSGGFSPGYADFPLSHQPALLEFLDTPRHMGLTVGGNLLMVPQKSITSILRV